MKHLKILGVALAAAFAFAAMTASSVLALPDVSLTLSGSTFPLHLNVTVLTVKTALQNETSNALTGEGLLLLLLLTGLSSLGSFETTFLKVTEPSTGNPCNTEGAASGVVSLKGTFHVVYTQLTPLTLGELFLPEEVKITCGSEKIKVKGSSLSSINAVTVGSEGTELTKLGGILSGNGVGTPGLSHYYLDSGALATAELLSNFGSGFVKSSENVAEEVVLTALGSNMFVITSR
jgi:hypothetical protein